MIFVWLLVFAASVYFLFQSSKIFTGSAEKIGLAIGIPAFIVGLTIVGIGTSLPELFISMAALAKGANRIVVANAIGSNVANILLVLGLVAVVFGRIGTSWKKITIDLPFVLGLSLVAGLMIWDGRVSLAEGLFLLFLYLLYLFFIFKIQEPIQFAGQKERRQKLAPKTILILLASVMVVYVSAKYAIESVIQLSVAFGLSHGAVGATLIALGTSLPELAVSLMAGLRGKIEIALGNIVGSNIFNLAGVIGIPALFTTLEVERDILVFTYPVMLIATILFIFFVRDRVIHRSEGIIFLLTYILFLSKMLDFF
jgi:cation:H+ antiporter